VGGWLKNSPTEENLAVLAIEEKITEEESSQELLSARSPDSST